MSSPLTRAQCDFLPFVVQIFADTFGFGGLSIGCIFWTYARFNRNEQKNQIDIKKISRSDR